jgi:hypothetical protein
MCTFATGPNDGATAALLDPFAITVHLVDATLMCPEVRVELWTNLAHCLMPQPELSADAMEETALLSLSNEQELYVALALLVYPRKAAW